MSIKIDATSKGVLIHRYLAKTEFTKFSPNFSYKKVGKKYQRYQKIEYTKSGYKIQWQNILRDIRFVFSASERLALKLGVPKKLAYQIGAIAFDAGSQISAATESTSIGIAHTCTGDNRVLVAYALTNGAGTESCTYNSVDMGAVLGSGSANYVDFIFAMAAPDTGSNNITFTSTSGVAPRVLMGTSFNGAAQSSFTDGITMGGETGLTQTITITTGTNNSMVCDFANGFNDTKVWTVNASQTQIFNVEGQNDYRQLSSYKAAPTAGAIEMTWTRESGAPSAYTNHSGIGIKEFVASEATTTIRRRQVI